MGFIQSRDIASSDDEATRVRKAIDELRRKFWYFFAATVFFTAFFTFLKAPDSWHHTALVAALQIGCGALLGPWMLRQLATFSPLWRWVFLVFPVLPLALHIGLRTPNSGLVIVLLWAIFLYSYLWQPEMRQAFRHRRA